MAKNDGGPAFGHGDPTHGGESGMSLRDWFAGQALMAMGTWIPPVDLLDEDGRHLPNYSAMYQRLLREARAEWAYEQADAMLKAREAD